MRWIPSLWIISVAENWLPDHLISLGHKRIACIAGVSETRYNQGRVNGFRDGITEAGLEVDEALIAKADFNIFSGLNVANQLLEIEIARQPFLPAAIFMAYGAMQAAYVKGYKIPDDLSVVGFDDIYISTYTTAAANDCETANS